MAKKKIKPSGLKPGDKVVMHTCLESRNEKYKDKIWTVASEPWDLCGTEVVLLEGFRGGFATEFLWKVDPSKIKGLTKHEAHMAMREGKKVSHRLFGQDEYLYINEKDEMYAEDGCRWEDGFFNMRHEPEWQDGWYVKEDS